MSSYNYKYIEKKWQNYWTKNNSFEPQDETTSKKPKKYILSMFPYPSGKIHMGHVRNYCIGDVYARYYRKQGFNVLHPIGWDSFGMPAENAAIKNKLHPKKWTYENISYMTQELTGLGLSFAVSRQFATSDELYTKHEQQFIVKMYEKGLLYRKTTSVNWCDDCQTVLANEQVEDGKCWRCDHEVLQRDMPGYYIAITKYAKRLLDDLEVLKDKWPKQVLTMQKNWIGQSTGLQFDMWFCDKSKIKLDNKFDKFSVYTTRPDTIYGISYCALACEHEVVRYLCENKLLNNKTINKIKQLQNQTQQQKDTDEKIGFDTGLFVLHPITKKNIPVWIANFVLVSYGGGAVMSVSAHDIRDHEFATKYDLPIIKVIKNNKKNEAYVGDGKLINSGIFNSLDSKEAREKIVQYFETHNIGAKKTNYKLRDWGISRQRYWGAPLPFVHCGSCGLVASKNLPVALPDDVKITGEGNPLENHETWSKTTCPKCGKKAKKETDTMDTFVQSSWYFLRYATNPNRWQNEAISKQDSDYWMNVDQYIGGIEHAILHLLYARFFTKVLHDMGYTKANEPFENLLTQGMVLKDGFKMSKSKGNVVDPGYIIDKYGADTARLFMMFAAPPTKELEWNDSAVEGSYKFIKRFYELSCCVEKIDTQKIKNINHDKLTQNEKQTRVKLYMAMKKQHEVINKTQSFNTLIASCMEAVNELKNIKNNLVLNEGFYILCDILEPIVPHLCWDISNRLFDRVNFQDKLAVNEKIFRTNTVSMAITINGKKRAVIDMSKSLSKEDILKTVKQHENIKKWLENKIVLKEIIVPNKLVNLVIK
ncbi:MAG: leucine--tRNA ligase [Epsilonproteobacteria bacterium]|nr:MAG: leucine--tRNA ligase [Campylobacterota bacterium]